MKEFYNLLLFFFIIFFIFLILKNLNFGIKEGMTDASGNEIVVSTSGNGIAGNAASYGAQLKAATIKLQDTFLISKYRSDYETLILNLDDLLNNLMLKSVLTAKQDNINESIKNLVELNQAKQALNNVMKFIDSS